MTTQPTNPTRVSRLVLLLAAFLTAILTLLAGPAGSAHAVTKTASGATTAAAHTASGGTGPAAETRVGASTLAVGSLIGAAGDIAAGQRRVDGFLRPETVLATSVAAEGLDDSVVLVRGGTNTADRFANGSGVTSDGAGNLSGVSVNSGQTVEDAAVGIKNNQIGVSSVGAVRNAGGTVTRAPTPNNPAHCLIGGCTADVFSDLFTPTIKNPWK